MSKFNFCGPSYTSQSLNADAQSTINWYPEQIESGDGNTNLALYPTPGTKSFATGAISGPVGIQNTLINLTAAQIKAANTIPILLIPAPTCPNRMIVPLSAFMQLNFNGTAYTKDSDTTIGFGASVNEIINVGYVLFPLTQIMVSTSTKGTFFSTTSSGQPSGGSFNPATQIVNKALYWVNGTDLSSDIGNSTVALNIQWIEVEVTTGLIKNGQGNSVHGALINLTAAQINTTAVTQLISSPGANQIIIPLSAIYYSHYHTTTGGQYLFVGLGTLGADVQNNACFATSPLLNAYAQDVVVVLPFCGNDSETPVGSYPNSLSTLVNAPLSITCGQPPSYVPPVGGGDETLTLTIAYLVVDVQTGALIQAGPSGGDMVGSLTSMTTAQIYAANTVPIQLVAAPGANLVNIPISYVATSTYNTAPFSYPGTVISDSHAFSAPCTGISQVGGAGTNYFVVAGDQTTNFPSSTFMTLDRSSINANNGVYTVVSSSFTGGSTHIVVSQVIPGAYATTGGFPQPEIDLSTVADDLFFEFMLLAGSVTPMFTATNNQIQFGTAQIVQAQTPENTPVETIDAPILWLDDTVYSGSGADSTGKAMIQYVTISIVNGAVSSQSSTVSSCGSSATGITRGLFTIAGRSFAVIGNSFNEVLSNGTLTGWGTVSNDALPVTMAASPQQLLLASAGTAYVFDLALNTLTAIPGATFSGPVSIVGICDDFFLAVIADSKEFYVSAPLNANDWTTNGSAIVSVFPDNIVSMIVDHREIFFASDTKSVWYYDSGNIFPFDVVTGGFVEAGSAAKSALVQLDNTIFWLGADERGTCVVWRGYGYTPQRVSNHAIEFEMQGYSRVDDAVAFAYQDQGHQFYVIYFPTPSKTWVYDTLTGMWHERGFWLLSIGQYRAAHYWNHTFNFGKHLVGDWQSDKIYQMHIPVYDNGVWDFADDDGNPIRRVRRSPHISSEQKRMFLSQLQVYLESGLGPNPPLTDGAGNPRGPQMTLRWSTDSAHTWSNEYTRDCGQSGEYRKRVRWLRLGRSRDRIFEITCSDPIPWRIVDSYLEMTPGTGI